jgi:hypothetical protein
MLAVDPRAVHRQALLTYCEMKPGAPLPEAAPDVGAVVGR